MDIVARISEIPLDVLEFFEPIPDRDNLPDNRRIAAEPLSAAHYAVYPSELCYRCLAAGTSSKGYCPTCGAPWCRVVETAKSENPGNKWGPRGSEKIDPATRSGPAFDDSFLPETKTIGWRPTCQCPAAEPRAGVVLDPFAGSGRTGIAAQRLGLDFVGCELNPEYAAMAEKLLHDAAPLFSGGR